MPGPGPAALATVILFSIDFLIGRLRIRFGETALLDEDWRQLTSSQLTAQHRSGHREAKPLFERDLG